MYHLFSSVRISVFLNANHRDKLQTCTLKMFELTWHTARKITNENDG